jgi:hypothetical protein
MWRPFLRVWIAALLVTMAFAIAVLRPDNSARILWHSRLIQMHGDALSDRALREGSQLRAFAPETPAFDEDANTYARRLQEVRKEVARNRQRARGRLITFFAVVLFIPLFTTALLMTLRALSRVARLRQQSH